MRERRKRRIFSAVGVGEVPAELEWLGKVADDYIALLGQPISVCVLVAHHDKSFFINRHFAAQLAISRIQVVDSAV